MESETFCVEHAGYTLKYAVESGAFGIDPSHVWVNATFEWHGEYCPCDMDLFKRAFINDVLPSFLGATLTPALLHHFGVDVRQRVEGWIGFWGGLQHFDKRREIGAVPHGYTTIVGSRVAEHIAQYDVPEHMVEWVPGIQAKPVHPYKNSLWAGAYVKFYLFGSTTVHQTVIVPLTKDNMIPEEFGRDLLKSVARWHVDHANTAGAPVAAL